MIMKIEEDEKEGREISSIFPNFYNLTSYLIRIMILILNEERKKKGK